jgi:hypothetical protein
VALPPPIGSQVESTFTNGSSLIRGNFTAFISGANVTVKDAAGDHMFRSGNWTEPIGPASQGSAYVRYHYFQWLRVSFEKTEMRLEADKREVHAFAGRLTLAGQTTAFFDVTSGFLAYGGVRRDLPRGRLNLTGYLSFETWNETGRLEVELRTRPEVLGFKSTPHQNPDATAPKLAKPDETGPSLWWKVAMGVAAVAGVVLLVNRRAGRIRIDEVEWALFSGHNKRALAKARALVRRRPRDANAIFLYGASLAAVGRADQVVEELEPLADRLQPAAQAGIAYLLTVAATRLGDRARADRWSATASRDPELRRRLQREGIGVPRTSRVDIAYA